MDQGIHADLLHHAAFGVATDHGRERVTLPGLLARMSHGQPTALTAVQAHQQHAVHAFLVQLASIALERARLTAIAHDENQWRKLLLDTASADGGGPSAFALIVDDLSKPAFLQPPVPEGTLDVLKNDHTQPSRELDVLITSKNHDVKIDRLGTPDAEHWALALLTLQTMQGFLGAGNYGIARMNGGFASRPCVGFAPDQDAAHRFVRDVAVLLKARPELEERFGQERKVGLVWCVPWNGQKSLSFAELDPFFIEICRRIRLTAQDGRFLAHRGSSSVARIDAKGSNGDTGDPWTPVSRGTGGGKGKPVGAKALTVPESGFTYERVQDLLFGDWCAGAAGEPQLGEDDRQWVGQVLVRGQGKTDGYHERWIPVPPKVRTFLAKPEKRDLLGKLSQGWIQFAEHARLRILKPALLTLLQGGPDKLKFDDDRGERFLARLDASIDAEFFALLFDHAESSREEADAAFQRRLYELAEVQLKAAVGSMPVPSARRWRAESRAFDLFRGAARKHFKLAFPPQDTAGTDPAAGGSP